MLLLVSTYLVVVMKPMILPILLGMRRRRVTIQALMSTSRTIVIIVAAVKKTNTNLKAMKTKMRKF
jgi:ammonia channel protein AmtB